MGLGNAHGKSVGRHTANGKRSVSCSERAGRRWMWSYHGGYTAPEVFEPLSGSCSEWIVSLKLLNLGLLNQLEPGCQIFKAIHLIRSSRPRMYCFGFLTNSHHLIWLISTHPNHQGVGKTETNESCATCKSIFEVHYWPHGDKSSACHLDSSSKTLAIMDMETLQG
jgi:hypothetical protein